MFNLNHNERGTHIITTPKELGANCNCIPENNQRINCSNGNILMHKKSIFGNKYYATKCPTNSIIYAVSRSKYYQMIVRPTINLNSRSKNQPNMIINDVNGTAYSDMKNVLVKRGYNVIAFNLSNQDIKSIHYNPLDLITKLAYQGRIEEAKRVCMQIANTIYNNKGEGKNAFFYTLASNLFCALVFSKIAFAFNNSYYLFSDSKPNNKLITISNILKSVNNLNYNQVINYFSKLGERLTKLDHQTALTRSQKNDVAILKVAVKNFEDTKMAGSKTFSSIYATFLDNLRIYSDSKVAKLTDKTTHVFRNHLSKPVALFIITSDQFEINQLATLLIEQINDILITNGMKFRKHLKFDRGTQFILDGIGSLPAISNLDRNLSIDLSVKTSYLLRFQNYEQIQYIYRNTAKAIVANCPLIYYVLSNSDKTIQIISNALGKRTISTIHNLNQKPKVNTYHLVPAERLKSMKYGEVAIIRTNDTGENMPWPIFDTGKCALPYK